MRFLVGGQAEQSTEHGSLHALKRKDRIAKIVMQLIGSLNVRYSHD